MSSTRPQGRNVTNTTYANKPNTQNKRSPPRPNNRRERSKYTEHTPTQKTNNYIKSNVFVTIGILLPMYAHHTAPTCDSEEMAATTSYGGHGRSSLFVPVILSLSTDSTGKHLRYGGTRLNSVAPPYTNTPRQTYTTYMSTHAYHDTKAPIWLRVLLWACAGAFSKNGPSGCEVTTACLCAGREPANKPTFSPPPPPILLFLKSTV